MGSGQILFLGTGTAFNDDGRGSQAIWLAPAGGPPFLVDIGPTAMSAARRYGAPLEQLDRLLVTHLHGDHTAGWPFLLLHWVFAVRRTRPFDVHGPSGTRECLEGLVRHCYGELLERHTFEIRYHEIPVESRDSLESGGLELDVYPMQHHASSIGYRLRVGELRVAVSGDTAWCDSLERLGQGSDLLILECTSAGPPLPAHVCLDEVRRGVERLGAARVVLIHLPDAVAAELARDPIPGVAAAHDGMKLEL